MSKIYDWQKKVCYLFILLFTDNDRRPVLQRQAELPVLRSPQSCASALLCTSCEHVHTDVLFVTHQPCLMPYICCETCCSVTPARPNTNVSLILHNSLCVCVCVSINQTAVSCPLCQTAVDALQNFSDI